MGLSEKGAWETMSGLDQQVPQYAAGMRRPKLATYAGSPFIQVEVLLYFQDIPCAFLIAQNEVECGQRR